MAGNKILAAGPGNGVVAAAGLQATTIDTLLMPGEGPVHLALTLEGELAPVVHSDLPRGTMVLLVAPDQAAHVRPAFKATPRVTAPPG